MRRFYITRNKDEYLYRDNTISGWCHTNVTDHASLMAFLTNNGRFDTPMIVFTDRAGQPCKLYEVSRPSESSILVTIDGRDRLPLIRAHFMSDSECADWFAGHEVSEITKFEADKKTSSADRLQYFQSNATESVKDMFERLCSEKMSNTNIQTYLQNQARIDGLTAEILFK